MEKTAKSPWLWIPPLYFAEGIPYFLVNNISVIMFTRMGMENGQMAFFTSLLYLPWVIKPLWSPFVDILRTKRWWVIAMQVTMALLFMTIALTLPHPEPSAIASHSTPASIFVLTLCLFWLSAFASATHDIAADGYYMLALDQKSQSVFVGIRSTFYRLSSIFGQGVLVVIAGLLETSLGDIPLAWKVTLLVSSALLFCITLCLTFTMPHPIQDTPRNVAPKDIFREFGRTFATFFKKKQISVALLFMLLYRLPEAFLVKMMNPFLLAPHYDGGLGLSTEAVGLVYGTAGAAALTLGGILGGVFAARRGLKRSLWPMALALALPCLCFVFLSVFQPSNIWIIGSCVVFDQFGYGFGFTAYMLYMMYFSEGEFKTAHYSLCTAFMALSMMLPGMLAGYMQEWLGYTNFFIFVMICTLVTVLVTFAIKVDPEYGKN